MEETAGVVKFEGQPPFVLPEAKSAQAAMFERHVVVTLYSEVEGHGPGLVSVVAQMTPDVAVSAGDPAHSRRLGSQGKGVQA
jgi:hypothetical protein